MSHSKLMLQWNTVKLKMPTNIFHCSIPVFWRLMLTGSSHLHMESAVEFGWLGEWLLKYHLQEELSAPGDTAPSMVSKAPIKMRQSKSRTTSSSSSSVPSVTMSSGTLPQQLTIYQPVPPQAHQYMVHSELYYIIRCVDRMERVQQCWHHRTDPGMTGFASIIHSMLLARFSLLVNIGSIGLLFLLWIRSHRIDVVISDYILKLPMESFTFIESWNLFLEYFIQYSPERKRWKKSRGINILCVRVCLTVVIP
jgi:hypothetical protein